MRTTFLLYFLLCHLTALGQEDEKVKDIIEGLAENLAEDDDLSELTERLAYFRKHPINLNNTSPEQLKSLVLLSPLQIGNFFSYVSAAVKLMNVLELQAVPGFDPETINRVLPFVTVKSQTLDDYQGLKNFFSSGNNDLILRYTSLLQKQKGFKDLPGSRYLGSQGKALLRYRYMLPEVASAALVMEKDPGESFFNKRTGTDHLSAHMALYNLGRIKKLVAGDYTLQFGQGLTLWSGFAFGKGPDVTSVAARDVGLKPYTSSNESSFFRGIAGSVDLGLNVHISPFVSFRLLDASLKAAPDGSFTLSNIGISGLHRSKTERINQMNLKQHVYGLVLQYVTDNLNLGLISYQTGYQHSFVTGTQLYNKYSFSGKRLHNTGLHYNYTFLNIYFYGEVANSFKTGWAMVNGAMATISSRLSAVLLHRNYDRDHHNFFSNAIGEATETSNEKGLYTGLNYTFSRSLTGSAYVDYFKFPWLRYRVDSASSGYEVLVQLAYTRAKTFKAVLRFKREQKQQNPDAGSSYDHLDKVIKQSCRLEWNWKLNRKFNFHQRTEITQYQKGMKKQEIGFIGYGDLNYKPLLSGISANMRLAYFNTPSYNSRIYAYEDDVLYGAGSGVYAGKGIRTFINIKLHPMQKADIWLRYAVYIYRGVETIGSGLDQIDGNKKSEIKLQLRYQF